MWTFLTRNAEFCMASLEFPWNSPGEGEIGAGLVCHGMPASGSGIR